MLSALALTAALAGGPDAVPAPRLRVEDGRARVASLEGARTVRPARAWTTLAPGARVEVPYGSRARLSWPGRASLDLSGPLVVEWTPPWSDGSEFGWDVTGSGTLRAEVRRGPAELRLPASSWTVRARASAFLLSGLPGGAAQLRHQAGAPLEVRPTEPGGSGRTTLVRQGRAVRLKAPR